MSREEKLHTILTITKINDSSGQKLIHVVADTKSVVFGKKRNGTRQRSRRTTARKLIPLFLTWVMFDYN